MTLAPLARLPLCLVALAAQPLLADGQARNARSGEPIPLASDVTMTVVRGTSDVFNGIDVDGASLVLELRIQTAEKSEHSFVYLAPFEDPEKSTVVLLLDGQRIAPTAVAATGRDLRQPHVTMVNDLLPTPTTGTGLWMTRLSAGQQVSVHVLFGVPEDHADKAMKLLVDMGLDGNPTPLEIEIGK